MEMWERTNFDKSHLTIVRNRWGHSGGWVGISLSLRAQGLFVVIPSPAVTLLRLNVGSYTGAHPRVQSIVEVSPDSRNSHSSWIVPWSRGIPIHTANRTAYTGVYAVNVAQHWAEGGQAFKVRVHPPGDYIRLCVFPWLRPFYGSVFHCSPSGLSQG